jgi:hypothetical protein
MRGTRTRVHEKDWSSRTELTQRNIPEQKLEEQQIKNQKGGAPDSEGIQKKHQRGVPFNVTQRAP